jgi:lipopolysaccharide transport system permease protein
MSTTSAGVGQVRLRPTASGLRHLRSLIPHLALRELASMHRFTLLGWAWPLVRQLVQFAVLLVVFTAVVDLGIPDYPAFILSGLLAWTWFSTGLQRASSSLISGRHLVFQPRFPALALPAVAVTIPLIDFLIALPVMVGVLVFTTGVHWTLVLLPVVMAVQLVLMLGIGWLTASLSVYLRDVAQIVGVGLLMVFYLTPVFYDHARVGGDYAWLLDLNPLTTLLLSYRDVMLDGEVPAAGPLALLAAVSALLALAGYAVFRRLEGGFVDEL